MICQPLHLVLLLSLTLTSPTQETFLPRSSQDEAYLAVSQADSAPLERVQVPPASAETLRYYRQGMVLWGIAILLSLAVPALILFTGFSATLRRVARRLGASWSLGTADQRRRGAGIELAAAAFVVLYLAVEYLAELPLSFYAGFVYQHSFGLSNQSLTNWLQDSLTTFGLEAAFFAVVIPLGYFLLKTMQRRWWLAVSAGGFITIIFLQVVHPIWIAPLFDEYGRMQDRALETQILDLAERAGIEESRVYEVKKSADTKRVNASVSGFMGTKRIVLWDTIIERLDRGQLLFVMGHEMGHFALGHAWKGLILACVGLVTTLYLASLALPRIILRCRSQFGFDDLRDIASLPLFVLTFQLLSFLGTPAGNAITRHWEHEADRFGLEITRDNRAAATTFVELQQHNLHNPRPGIVYKLWRGSHPPLAERVEFANTYSPWTRGAKLKYQDRFRSEGG